MDHRRKHGGLRPLGDGDYEVGEPRSSAAHPPGPRRSRLSALALLSLGLLVAFVGIITVVHFSHVNTLHSASTKSSTGGSVVLRREDIEVGVKAGTAAGTGAGGNGPSGEATAPGEFSVGDDDDYGSDDDGVGDGAVGEDDHDGAGNDDPIDKGEKDDDGAGNDNPADEGEGDDDGAANDEPIDKGEKDDDGAANDHPIDKGEKDDDGAANDEPIDKGEKDDDGAANDEPIDKGEKDDDGAANDEPIDKGEKDDDGAANDQPIDKGDKDDDGAANDQPIDKGDKDEDEPEDDPLAAAGGSAPAVGEGDDDGAQNDNPLNLHEDDDKAADPQAAATAGGSADSSSKPANAAGGVAKAAAASKTRGGDKAAKAGKAGGRSAGGGDEAVTAELADDSNPEQVEEVTDYNDEEDSSDLYVIQDTEFGDYDANHDVDLGAQDHHQQQLQQQQQEAARQEHLKRPQGQQGQEQPKKKKEQQQEPKGHAAGKSDKGAEAKPAAVAVAADECGPLSRELLDQWAVNGTVMVAFTNSIMFRNFGPTWLHHVRKAGIKYWVLAVADGETAKLVRSHGADHCFLVHENEIDDTAAAFEWGSRSWQLHTWQKVLVVRHVHHLGFHVINSDMDVVWLQNPLEHFLVKYTAPDYWVSMDPITTQNPIGDDGPEAGVSTHHYMNTGVYFLRQTPGGRALIDKWYDIRVAMQQAGFHDQDGLYNYLKDGGQNPDFERRVTRVVDGKTNLAQLPATLFQNGYSHCINQIHKIHGLQPFEVHFVWVWGGNAGKINRMREQMYYIDPPSYHSDGTFVSFDVKHIEEPAGFNNWTDTEAMVQTHLQALDSQLTDTWHGLALATLLNRTVVLPKFKCFCIQNWFENPQCRLPGEPHTRFPLSPACPADYVFNMDVLAGFNVSGRRVPFREFSFLDNERTPAEVKNRPLVVVARPGVSAPSRDGDTLTIPAGLKSDALLDALKPFLQPPPKRLHFSNPRSALAGWSDSRAARDFEVAVSSLAVRWCCRPDAVAKQYSTDVHHQLQLHAGPSPSDAAAAAAARRLLGLP